MDRTRLDQIIRTVHFGHGPCAYIHETSGQYCFICGKRGDAAITCRFTNANRQWIENYILIREAARA